MVRAVLNERSLDISNRDIDDIEALSRFVKTFDALRSLIPARERWRLSLATPPNLGALRLPAGTALMEALHHLAARDEVEGQLAYSFLDAPHIDDSDLAIWQFNGKDALGLSYALRERSVVVSIEGPTVRKTKLLIKRAISQVEVVNAWRPVFDADHVAALGLHITVLPAYDNPGTHDPSSPRRDPSKSLMPEYAERLLENGVHAGGDTWWALCEHDFFHRFQPSGGAPVQGRRLVHWNGTTNPKATDPRTREEHVSVELRSKLREEGAVSGCGCREV